MTGIMSPNTFHLFLLLWTALGVECLQRGSSSVVGDSSRLVRQDVARQALQVVRGRAAFLLPSHLPIGPKALHGDVCHVEVEELQPLVSMVGHLEPKNFPCNFAKGDVVYYHNGNPLIRHDHVQVTVFYFRTNLSVAQTEDIMVEVVNEDDVTQGHPDKLVQVTGNLTVGGVKAVSQSLSADLLSIAYDPASEDCRLSYQSPEYLDSSSIGLERVADYQDELDGSGSPPHHLGVRPLTVGGVRRWPLFGQLVTFNRSVAHSFDIDCQAALLQGYRYMHRQANSPGIDFLPLQVTIWSHLPASSGGGRQLKARRGLFVKIVIESGQPLTRPVARIFRQVNVTDIGGSLSILPRDCISIPQGAVPGLDLLDVNMTRMDGPTQAQVVNLRDPSRPITSFRLADLHEGLIALQLINYNPSVLKVFVITMSVIDPFFQSSRPFDLKIVTYSRPIVYFESGPLRQRFGAMPSFQVFSFPMFSYTGATTYWQSHNIQVVGYIDETAVVYTTGQPLGVPALIDSFDGRRRVDYGEVRLDGVSDSTLSFTSNQLLRMKLTYTHTGTYQPSAIRIPITVTVPSPTPALRRLRRRTRRSLLDVDRSRWRRSSRSRSTKRFRRSKRVKSKLQQPAVLELPIRIVRLYDRIHDDALKPGIALQLRAYSHICISAEQLIRPSALAAMRSDKINALFSIKVAPSQGQLVLDRFARSRSTTDSQMTSGPGLEQGQLSVIWLSDLETGAVCYVNHHNDHPTDHVGLKQIGPQDFPTVYLNLDLLPSLPLAIVQRMDSNVMLRVRETSAYVQVTPLHLHFSLEHSPMDDWGSTINASSLTPESIVYRVLEAPRLLVNDDADQGQIVTVTHEAGRLVSLSSLTVSGHVGDMTLQSGLATNLKDAQAPSVATFSQAQINAGDIVYALPTHDVGITDKIVVVSYTVSGPGGIQIGARQLRILLEAVDNKAPVVEVKKPLQVQRDGQLVLCSDVIGITDIDTPIDKLEVRFKRLPKHGHIELNQTRSVKNSNQSSIVKVKIDQPLSVEWFKQGFISYKQSGINVKIDTMSLQATDGHQSSPVTNLTLQITRRILAGQEVRWNALANESIVVSENATLFLQRVALGADDLNHLNNSSMFIVIVPPTKGKLVGQASGKSKRPPPPPSKLRAVDQFTLDDLDEGRIAYRHGPTEIGSGITYDSIQLWELGGGQTYNLNITVMPINSQVPRLTSEAQVQVKEGGRVTLTQYNVYASDKDTPDADIQLQVIHPPRWGHLEINTNATINRSLPNDQQDHLASKAVLAFSMQQLKNGLVDYVNSRHANGQESTEDLFTIRAYDGKFSSYGTVEVKLAIQPVNDERPQVKLLRYFSVPAGSRRVLTPHLISVVDRDEPRDLLQIKFTQLPIYGDILVSWRHGETSRVEPNSPPITQSYLGMLNLIYSQNASLLTQQFVDASQLTPTSPLQIDSFTLSVSDGRHVVERSTTILIRPPNKQSPTFEASNDGILLDGVSWTPVNRQPGGLVISDPDTPDEDLVLTLARQPQHGFIQRLPRMQGRSATDSHASDGLNEQDNADLIELAWDLEESRVAGNIKASKQLANDGSIGGLEEVKRVEEGARFTKRQVATGRIHYVYTGNYTEHLVTDDCLLRLSDGRFTSGPIKLSFKILRASPNKAMQSPSAVDDGERLIQHSRREVELSSHREALMSDARYNATIDGQLTSLFISSPDEPFPVLKCEPLFVSQSGGYAFLSSQSVLTGGPHLTNSQLQQISINPDQLREYAFKLTSQPPCGSLVMTSNTNQEIHRFTFTQLVDRQVLFLASPDCLHLIGQSFSLHLVVTNPSLTTNVELELFQPILINLESGDDDPVILFNSTSFAFLPETDLVLTPNHLSVLRPDAYYDPSLIFYLIASVDGDSKSPDGVIVKILSNSGREDGLVLFTQHQVNVGQVVLSFTSSRFNTTTLKLLLFDAHRMTTNRLSNTLVDNDESRAMFDLVRKLSGSGKLRLSSNATLEQSTNIFLDQMKYQKEDGSICHSLRNPIEIKLVEDTLEPLPIGSLSIEMGDYQLVTQSPPPGSIESIKSTALGYAGFCLTARHIYTPWPEARHSLVVNQSDPNLDRLELIDLESGRSIREFKQSDVNRRKLAAVIVAKTLPSSRRQRRYNSHQSVYHNHPVNYSLRDTDAELRFKVEFDANSQDQVAEYSLNLEWTKVSFQRYRYTVCNRRGLLQVRLLRSGSYAAIQATSAQIYVGLLSETALEGRDFALHSSKLVKFGPGETDKFVSISMHPRKQNWMRSRKFYVELKSPAGTILADRRRRALVSIDYSPHCLIRAYFESQTDEESSSSSNHQTSNSADHGNLGEDDDGRSSPQWESSLEGGGGKLSSWNIDRVEGDRYNSSRISTSNSIDFEGSARPKTLSEWLSINRLPDSKELAASYEASSIATTVNEKSLEERKSDHPITIDYSRSTGEHRGSNCSQGWYYYNQRCYRLINQVIGVSGDDARDKCEDEQAFLVTISSQDQLSWLKRHLGIRRPFWIGLYQRSPTESWVWHNLEQLGFSQWAPSYPRSPRWRLRRSVRRKRRSSSNGPRVCAISSRPGWKNLVCKRPMQGVDILCMKNPLVSPVTD